MAAADSPGSPSARRGASVLRSEIGTKAGANYQGDGLIVTATGFGARLRCVFQRLDAEATSEGLWLVSTVSNSTADRFRFVASQVGRAAEAPLSLAQSGDVTLEGATVRFARPGLVEEYSVSMDGLRQDFVVTQRPAGDGELQVFLDVTGATVEDAAYGAQLVLENSGRKIAYSRLRVTDATGRELPARIQIQCALPALAVVVNDEGATYPVRVDPTFSDANWISMGGLPAQDFNVWALAVDDDHNIYIGGQFGVVGNVIANNVAKWNGSSWSPLGKGLTNGNAYAIAIIGSNVFVGGRFTTAINSNGSTVSVSRIARWNGSNWSAMGSGLNDEVYALAVLGTNLYAGGRFRPIVARWTGTAWAAVGPVSFSGNVLNYAVQCLTATQNELYAGGEFTATGTGAAASMVARWNGTNWLSLGSGISGGADQFDAVYAIAVSGSNVYAGGSFQFAGGSPATNIAYWDGTNWFPMGTLSYNIAVTAIAADATNVFVGSEVNNPGVWKWTGTNWTQLPGSTSVLTSTYALTMKDGILYGGGYFGGLGYWDGTNWSRFSIGNNGSVYSLAPSDAGLVVAGAFSKLTGDAYFRIARWTGSGWSPIGLGLNGQVNCVGVVGNDLYAAGAFTFATNNGGQAAAANRIARWDGANWSGLGGGLSNTILALAVSTNGVFAGGTFTNAGGTDANRIARWDGTNWSSLGSGLNANVSALCLFGGNLIAGGSFTNAGGVPAKFVAQWNGTAWSALADGVNSNVLALAVSDSDLYAAGNFTNASGILANRVARWNGNSWSAVGLGLNGGVSALNVDGAYLYAGGDFTQAGGNSASRLARWNGSNWSALGSGMNNTVRALAMWDGDLFAGGSFTIAGGKVSAYIARALLNEGSVLSLQPGVPGPNTATFTFAGIPTNSYPVQFATNLTTSPWFTLSTNAANANGRGTVLDPAATNDQRFYRVLVP